MNKTNKNSKVKPWEYIMLFSVLGGAMIFCFYTFYKIVECLHHTLIISY